MKVLINGSSVSSGFPEWYTDIETGKILASQLTWPYRLCEKINIDMTNLAVSGAGNTYIHNSTIEEISQRSYDLVLIMWADYNRIDYQVSNPELFSSLCYTSLYQRSPLKVPPEIAQGFQHITNDWIFSGEYQMGHQDPHLQKLFGYTEYTNAKIQLKNTLIKIISLQSVLKSLNVPYRFMFYRELVELKKFNNFTNLIDWDNVIPTHLYSFAHEIGEWDTPRVHPTPAAYDAYADTVVEYLKSQKLI